MYLSWAPLKTPLLNLCVRCLQKGQVSIAVGVCEFGSVTFSYPSCWVAIDTLLYKGKETDWRNPSKRIFQHYACVCMLARHRWKFHLFICTSCRSKVWTWPSWFYYIDEKQRIGKDKEKFTNTAPMFMSSSLHPRLHAVFRWNTFHLRQVSLYRHLAACTASSTHWGKNFLVLCFNISFSFCSFNLNWDNPGDQCFTSDPPKYAAYLPKIVDRISLEAEIYLLFFIYYTNNASVGILYCDGFVHIGLVMRRFKPFRCRCFGALISYLWHRCCSIGGFISVCCTANYQYIQLFSGHLRIRYIVIWL